MKDRIELIHDYFAGELSPQQHQALEAWLRENPDHLDQFVREAYMHHQLLDAKVSQKMLNESLADLPLSGALWTSDEETLRDDSLGNSPDASSFFTYNGMLPKLGLLFCVLALIAVATIWLNHQPAERNLPQQVAQDETGVQTISKVRDDAVASVELLEDCTWKNDSTKPAQAISRVESGRTLHLLEGKAQVSFDCGAVLTLTGPTKLRVDSKMDATLLDGKVSAVVSQEAIGFLLHTTEMDVRDLGTEFDVQVDPKNGTKVEVVDGEVEADLTVQPGRDKETISLTEGQYLRTGNKQSFAPKDLMVFQGTRIDFSKPNSLDLFTIQRPDASLYRLDSETGNLILDATAGSIYARVVNPGDNLFLLPIPSSTDLDVILTVNRFVPRTVIEHIGIVYMNDEDNYNRLIYARGNGNYMKFTVEKNGVPFGEAEKSAQFGSKPFKLRLTRRGDEISAWWSVDDGKTWNFRDKGTATPNAKYVGFYVANHVPRGTCGGHAWIERFEVECSK